MIQRKKIVECIVDEAVGFKKKCELFNIPRGSMYYKPITRGSEAVDIMNELRDIYLQKPFYGYRRMTVELRKRGFIVNHKKVRILQQKAGIQAIYSKKNTSIKNHTHKVFPYLLNGLAIVRPNQVWQVDITYIKMKRGFLYLTCFIDVFSRKIMGWNLSISLDTSSCLNALQNALKHGHPEIINSDQGCQFTSVDWITMLTTHDIKISMDGKGRWVDNVFIERLWRTIKYELVFLHSFETVEQARLALSGFIHFYNTERQHSKLNYHTPDDVFYKGFIPTKQELFSNFALAHAQRQQEAKML